MAERHGYRGIQPRAYVEPLRFGVDVPDNAVFFDEYLAGDRSVHGSYALPNAVAIYERDAGSLWDRTDRPRTTEMRGSRGSWW